jgi:hypothetical protein
MELIDPSTNRAIILDKFQGRLAGWLTNQRILKAIFQQRLLTPGDVAMMRKHSEKLTLSGMARTIERILDNRVARRVVVSSEMKRAKCSRTEAKSEIDGHLMWARELLRPSRAGLITFN